MTEIQKNILIGLFNGITASGGWVGGALLEMPRDASIADIGSVTWLITFIMFTVGASKMWLAMLQKSKGQ